MKPHTVAPLLLAVALLPTSSPTPAIAQPLTTTQSSATAQAPAIPQPARTHASVTTRTPAIPQLAVQPGHAQTSGVPWIAHVHARSQAPAAPWLAVQPVHTQTSNAPWPTHAQAPVTGRSAHAEPTRRQAVQAALDALVAAGAPGALAETRDENGNWTGTAGTGDLRTHAPVPRNGRWRIGSVTKSFVAALVLKLVDEKKIVLDAPIGRYLPGLLPRQDKITVRMLLNHTGGIADYAATFDETPAGLRRLAETTYTPRRLIAIGTNLPPTSDPGVRWAYSNTGYAALGLLIEKVTGQSLSVALHTRVIAPLGLRSTYLPTTARGIAGPHPHGYMRDEKNRLEDITTFNPSNAWAAGAIVSTTSDVNRFFDQLLRGRLFSPGLLTQMKQTVPVAPGFEYGLGLMKLTLSCGTTVWGHKGHIPGYATYSFHTDRRNITVAATALPSLNDAAIDQAMNQAMNAEFCS
ncbi:serine hydrolase domain-containing protein [Streptosporangium saharense]|uniref:D-alanyl-D-alanine carboxypeptidase n=1 Tax=Streptosporangium saharense TaxID=1706840 RepID=A0A7W7QV34_9ACTN|nr:serine hydrolase domain-containing protein [Streptosporangium saharense]MBB4920316.1 D-alanyl-D-alanine carboxypeptidase [Streptosporangium saharense]